jgi:3-dehydroquinate synthase
MEIACGTYKVFIKENLDDFIAQVPWDNYSKLIVIVDENTCNHCYPSLQSIFPIAHQLIEIKSGEIHKNITTCSELWSKMIEGTTDRKALVMNLGGGVIGDMGGFVASTYMRGLDFIQMPTTLLSQVDASVGGKLGIDFHHNKNMVGIFNNPLLVWCNTSFLSSLPKKELRSGFAEIIKHAIIQSPTLWSQITNINSLSDADIPWTQIVHDNVAIKQKVVDADPIEKGLRKILNYGHTIGHALEAESLEKNDIPLLHGEAIAIGMICEAHIAKQQGHLVETALEQISSYIIKLYGKVDLSIFSTGLLLDRIRSDKKNEKGAMLFSIPDTIGNCLYNVEVKSDEIIKSITYYKAL